MRIKKQHTYLVSFSYFEKNKKINRDDPDFVKMETSCVIKTQKKIRSTNDLEKLTEALMQKLNENCKDLLISSLSAL